MGLLIQEDLLNQFIISPNFRWFSDVGQWSWKTSSKLLIYSFHNLETQSAGDCKSPVADNGSGHLVIDILMILEIVYDKETFRLFVKIYPPSCMSLSSCHMTQLGNAQLTFSFFWHCIWLEMLWSWVPLVPAHGV